MTGCAFSGNSASLNGGTIWSRNLSSYPVTLANCTLSGNATTGEGGGFYGTGRTTVANCVFWGNSDSGGMDESAQIGGGAPTINYSCVQGWTGGWGGEGNMGDDPLFVDADGPDDLFGTEDDNPRLDAGSPCIDAADNEAVPADTFDLDGDGDTDEPIPFDLDGNPRFVDDPDTDDTGNPDPDYADLPIVDMGAYEFQVPCPGDIDGDGDTDHADLGALLGAWGSQPGDPNWNPDADLDGDGHIGHGDLGVFLPDWGCGS